MDQANKQVINQASKKTDFTVDLIIGIRFAKAHPMQLYYFNIITLDLHCMFTFIVHDDTILDYSQMHRGLRVLKLVTTAILRNQIFMTMYITTVTTI